MPLFMPETWPFSLDLLPKDAYLVGGSVRDRLLLSLHSFDRQPAYLDLDFVIPHRALETAAAIAKAYRAGFVVLDEARQIGRVVFDRVTVDFAQQQGDCLAHDLGRRDFTINAIAYSPHQQVIVDPLGGEADIRSQIMQMVSYENLKADPLRLLRGYRQSAQLGFTLAPDTQAAIKALAPTLRNVSAERVRSELDALLSVDAASVDAASEPRSLIRSELESEQRSDQMFNQSSAQRHVVRQSGLKELLESLLQSQLLQFYLPHFNEKSLLRLVSIDSALARLKRLMPGYAQTLYGWYKLVPAGSYRSWIKVAKLSCLVSADPAIAQFELNALKYSRHEIQVVTVLLQSQGDIEAMQQGEFGRSRQFFSV